MALNFPDSPSTNQTYVAAGRTWVYNGSRWALVTAGAVEITPADGSITAAKIADGTVVAAEIANSAITTAKINDGAVTAIKLGNDISLTPADGSITTAKIADANVTTAKVAANAITQAKLASNLSAVTVTTTANRDTDIPSPFTGQLVFLTDTKKIQVWDGTSWLNITLAPPETPTSLSAIASPTSVAISFTIGADNGSAISNHKYALSTDGGSTYNSFTALNPVDITSPITISGLSMNTEYYVKIKTVNGIGDSVASAAVSFTTEGVPGAPTSLSASNITGSTADIAFTAGAANGSAITNYKFAVSTDDITYGSFTALATPDASTPITVTGLSTGTAQYVKLKAVNANGDSAASASVSLTTLNTVLVDYLIVSGGSSGSPGTANSGDGRGGGGGGSVYATAQGFVLGTTYAASVGGASTTSTLTGAQTPSAGTIPTGGSPGGGNGAGAGGAGGNGSYYSITGTGTYYGGGGGGGVAYGASPGGPGGAGGGGYGATDYYSGGSGGANTGGGGGGSSGNNNSQGAGGSGIIIFRYPNTRTITIGAGLTGSTATDGSFRVTSLTSGSGNVSWA